jgi:hypothetical protein
MGEGIGKPRKTAAAWCSGQVEEWKSGEVEKWRSLLSTPLTE